MKIEKAKSFSIAFIFGFVIWALSPFLTDKIEPWDGSYTYYIFSLISTGFAVGYLVHRNLFFIYAGVFSGQIFYMLCFTPKGPLLLIGIGFLAGYSILSLIAAFFVARIRGVT